MFQSPINSSLVCSKDFLNRTNCQLIESALLNPNLTNRQIKNVKEPHRKTIEGRSNVIWLATDIKIWHGRIQNVYYPSSLFLDTFLYRTNRQVSTEIEKLNSFINSSRNGETLTIERKVPKLFFILVWILILPLVLPIIFIFICPIVTYDFDLKTMSLSVAERILFSLEETAYSLKDLKIISKIQDKEPSMVLIAKDRREYIIKDFRKEKVLPKILEFIKPFATTLAKAN